MTLPTTPSTVTASNPAATITAPTTPPISACEDEDGMPSLHVSRFHVIPPSSPARMIVVVIACGSTMSSAIVAATFSEMKAPTKFNTAASPTAIRGFNARVAIDVAIALAVS